MLSRPEASFYAHFGVSDLAAPEWRIVQNDWLECDAAFATSGEQHLMLFQIILGEPLGIIGIPHHHRESMSGYPQFGKVLGVCALAEYYGCLTTVAAAIIEMMEKHGGLWEDVARDPLLHVRLSVKLEWKDLFLDATRHILAAPVATYGSQEEDLQNLADHLETSVEDLQRHVSEIRDTQAGTLKNLNVSLRRLSLVPSYGEYGGQRHPVRITFANQLQNEWEGRPDRVRSLQTSRFLACSIFGQWFTEQEVGEHVVLEGRRKSKPSGPFTYAVARLEQAAASRNPSGLFGPKALEQVLGMLGLGDDGQIVNEVRSQLKEIVLSAAEYIKEAFAVRDESLHDGTSVTFRRARYEDTNRGYFTFLPVDETKFPWEDVDDLDAFWQIAIEQSVVPSTADRLKWEAEQRELEEWRQAERLKLQEELEEAEMINLEEQVHELGLQGDQDRHKGESREIWEISDADYGPVEASDD